MNMPTGDEMTESKVEETVDNKPVQLKQEDMIEFGEFNFMNGEAAALEWVLSFKRDQLSFQTRRQVQARYDLLRRAMTESGRQFSHMVNAQVSGV